jgi:beta-dihydromenaquinone-9 omega-hydroxylase
MAGTASGQQLDPFSAEMMDNPYPTYAELLQGDEPVFLEERGMWLVLRYEHVAEAARDHAGLASGEGITYHRTTLPVLSAVDEPDHGRLRRVLSHGFTPRRVRLLQSLVEEACGGLLDEAVALGELDLIQQAVVLLPVRVITAVLGIPGDDVPRLKLTEGVLQGFIGDAKIRARDDPGPGDPREAALQLRAAKRALQSVAGLSAFLNTVLRERRGCPLGDDLVSRLFAAQEEGRLSEDEVRWMCFTLLIGGQETMAHFLGNMLQALLDNPDQFRLLRERPDLIGPAIEETARYYPPIQNAFRTATDDVVLGATTIPRNARVQLSYAAANRDPRVFPASDEFRVDREMDGHLGFGAGVHMCLGQHLVRLQASVFLRMLIERTEDIEVIGEMARITSPALRGLDHLPVRLTPKSPGRRSGKGAAERD